MDNLDLLRKNGIFIHNFLKYKPKDPLKNIYTTNDLKTGTIIMQIPYNKLITENQVFSNPIINLFDISKYNKSVHPSQRISMSDEQIGSREGLAALRETGYKTNQDRIDGGGGNGGVNQPILGSSIQKTAVKDAPDGPTSAELELTEEERLLRIKRKGRRSTKLSSTNDELTLSKKTLLG